MKIIILSDYSQPILGYTPTFLAKEYIKQGHKVLILTSNHYYPFPDYKNTFGKILGKRKQPVGFRYEEGIPTQREKMRFEVFNRCNIENIEKNIKEFKPEIVILGGVTGISIINIAKIKYVYNFRLVCFDSNLMSILSQGGFLKSIFYFIFRVLFSSFLEKRVDKFIGVQEETCEIINKYYGIKKDKIKFISLGTDIEKFRFDKEKRIELRKKYNLSDDSILLIYTGKLIKDKGYDLLIESTSKIIKENKNVFVLIIGSGSDKYISRMNQEIKNIKQNYIFESFVKNEELYKYYSMSDIGIWPLQESVTMIEAAACNLPFIANDKIGTKLRTSNNNALLYKQGNVEDLYKKIKYLVDNKQERIDMGKRGRELVEKKLSWKEISKKYLDI